MNKQLQISIGVLAVLLLLYYFYNNNNVEYYENNDDDHDSDDTEHDSVAGKLKHGVEDAAHEVEHVAEDIAHGIEHGVETAYEKVSEGVNKVGDFVENHTHTQKQHSETHNLDYFNDFDNEFGPVNLQNPLANIKNKIPIDHVMGEMDKSSYIGADIHDPTNLLNQGSTHVYKSELDSQMNIPPQNLKNMQHIKKINNNQGIHETDHKNGFNGFNPENFFKTEAGVFKNELELEATDGPNPLPDGNISDTLTEGFTNGEEKTAEVNLIWAKWCGFCKKAMPDWERLEQSHNGSNINGYKLILNKYEESDNSDLIGNGKKFEVDGFPTIIIVKNDSSEQIKFNSIEYEDMIQKITNNL